MCVQLNIVNDSTCPCNICDCAFYSLTLMTVFSSVMCAPEAGENQHMEMLCWSGLGVAPDLRIE